MTLDQSHSPSRRPRRGHGLLATAGKQALRAAAAAGAAATLLTGCGMILGLEDHELFPEPDASSSSDGLVEGAASSADAADPIEGSKADGSDAQADGPQGAGEAGGSPDAAGPCPSTPCAEGTCCYHDGLTSSGSCESSCTLGSYPLACTGAKECEAGACCATLVGETVEGVVSEPPRCAGWIFEGSTCRTCSGAPPAQCGSVFTLQMCASPADCPTEQPYCCRVTEDNPFTYCVDSALAASPSICLPP